MAEKAARSLREEFPNATPLGGGSGTMFKWNKVGTRLRGKFIRLREGNMGGQLVQLDTGSEIVTASAPTTLADALDGVKPGTEVVIEYQGSQPSKQGGGKEVKLFEVVAL